MTWDVAGTDGPAVGATQVRITFSEDGGLTYPHVLAEATANDGSADVVLPNIPVERGRIMVEGVGNAFFAINDADVMAHAAPVVTHDAAGGQVAVAYSDSLDPTVTVSAADADSSGSSLTAVATGLPAGLELSVASTSADDVRPGTRTWTVTGTVTAAPGDYPVSVVVKDDTGGTGTTGCTVVVEPEDAELTYTGDELVYVAPVGGTASVELRATVRDSSVVPGSGDDEPVSMTAGAYYAGSATAQVRVPAADGGSVTGSGHWASSASSEGTHASDPGSRADVGVNVRYAPPTSGRLNGSISAGPVSGGVGYELRSTSLETLGTWKQTEAGAPCTTKPSTTCWGLGAVRATADLVDTRTGATVASGLELRITFTDRGAPGRNDTVSVTAWDGSTLVHSSSWTGTTTSGTALTGGGNLNVQ